MTTKSTENTKHADQYIVSLHLWGRGGAECLRCGRRYVLELPCDLEVWMAAWEAFERKHRHCPPRGAK